MWRKKPTLEGLPKGFRVQRIWTTGALAVSELPPAEIARYFREHPEIAKELLGESSDKRFTPSTFILADKTGACSVGWFTRDARSECVKNFSNLADAATDYILFSLGKGRWTPTD